MEFDGVTVIPCVKLAPATVYVCVGAVTPPIVVKFGIDDNEIAGVGAVAVIDTLSTPIACPLLDPPTPDIVHLK